MTPAVAMRLLPVLLVGALVIAGFALMRGEDERHVAYVTIPDAGNMIAGQDIRLAGTPVGAIGRIDVTDSGRRARVELRFEDRAWPLRSGTKLTLRWGGTVNYSNRYLALTPGSASGATLREGANLPPSALTVPVEYDSFVKTFTPAVRADLRRMLDNSGPALKKARDPLARTLTKTPPALGELSSALNDVVRDSDKLDTLVRSADATAHAIDAADPGLRDLLSAAGATLDATASRASQLRDTLALAPRTFATVRDTLERADPTLATVARFAERVAPGVAEVRKLTPALNDALATLVKVGPDAVSSLSTARRGTADINPFLSKVTRLMPVLGSIGTQSTEQLPCLRPYTPDIVAFLTNWGDFISSTDGRDHYFRAYPQVLLPASTNTQSMDSGQAARAFPGLRYAFPRPPGHNAGRSWFQPECGITEDALDPSKDPESRGRRATRKGTQR